MKKEELLKKKHSLDLETVAELQKAIKRNAYFCALNEKITFYGVRVYLIVDCCKVVGVDTERVYYINNGEYDEFSLDDLMCSEAVEILGSIEEYEVNNPKNGVDNSNAVLHILLENNPTINWNKTFNDWRKELYPTPYVDVFNGGELFYCHTNDNSPYNHVADYLEKEILKTRIFVKDWEYGITPEPHQLYLSVRGEELMLSDAPLFVRNVANLITLLRNTSGDLLTVLYYPEIYQTAQNEIILARAIAMLANAGLNLLVVTHSEHIIRELNILTVLHKKQNILGSDEAEDIKPEMVLNAENIKVTTYTTEFNNVKVDSDGFEVEFMNKTITKQNLMATEVYFSGN